MQNLPNKKFTLSSITDMKFEDLDDDVVENILQQLPRQTLSKLLKFKACSRVAYQIYFKEISVGVYERDPDFHKDFFVPDDQQYSSGCDIYFGIRNPFPFFSNVKSFLYFYENHPLFIPHTIHYNDPEIGLQLQELNILQRFKFLYFDPYKIERHDLHVPLEKPNPYPLGRLEKTWMVAHLKTLRIDTEIPSIPLPSVETLIVANKHFRQQHFHLFPNLKEMQFHSYTNLPYADLTIYAPDDIHPTTLDFSSLHQLKILRLDMGLVGIDEFGNYNVIFPPQLREVTLDRFNDTRSLHSLQNLTCLKTLSLSIQHQKPNDRNVSDFRLQVPIPPNVNDLHIYSSPFGASEPLDIRTILLPSQLTNLKLENVLVPSNYQFPNTLKVLNIGTPLIPRWDVPTFDLSHLTNLTHLSTGRVNDSILPPQLKHLKGKGTLARGSNHYPIDIESVTNILGILDPTKFKESFCMPIQAITGTTEDGHYVEVVDRLREARFPHVNLGSGPQKFLVPKIQTLKSLHLFRASSFNDFLNFQCLYCLPDTLEALDIDGGRFDNPLPCSKNLKYLKLRFTHLERGLIFNEKLEVLSIMKSTCNISEVLRNPAPLLQTIHLVSCALGPMNISLLETNLQHFSIERCRYELIQVQVPDALITFEMTRAKN